MKKMFYFVLILVVSLVLVGCMDDANESFVNSDNSNKQIRLINWLYVQVAIVDMR